MVIGYTTGVYDLFHIGHLNLLKNARGLCDKLIVGVTVDKLVEYKNKRAVIPFEERIEIVRNIKLVDAAIPQEALDKFAAWEKLKFDVLFVGDDWYQDPSWQAMEEKFKAVGVRIIYFPYTKGISSTIISHALRTLRSDDFDPKTASMKNTAVDSMKNFCMSSYLMFRYVFDQSKSFDGMHRPRLVDLSFARTPVRNADELLSALKSKVEEATADGKAALALSGGMDSAILAKFMPEGSTAYTFRCVVPGKQVTDESERARAIADACGLNHKIVDISWDDQIANADVLMKHKHAPIHSIESQIYHAALRAKADGFTKFILGENADIIYGGMDGLLAKDWTVGEFIERYSYVMPHKVLRRPTLIAAPFDEFDVDGHIDGHKFINKYFRQEALGTYTNACETAGVKFVGPYSETDWIEPIDYQKIRAGQSKYVIREAFAKLYPDVDVPKKIPMPRPMNEWMSDWTGPQRKEFIPHCTDGMKGDQKWMVYCLERFLNLLDQQ